MIELGKYLDWVGMTIRIGVQGGPGSFNDEAAAYYVATHHVPEYEILYLYTTGAVLQFLAEGRIDYGQFALYNSYAGPVAESIQAIGSHRFQVKDWYSIPVVHHLMCRGDTGSMEIDTIMTHPQVFSQCRKTLRAQYPHLHLVRGEAEMIDAARVAAALQNDSLSSSIATLGCRSIAARYGLRIIASGLQDDAHNATTFLLVAAVL